MSAFGRLLTRVFGGPTVDRPAAPPKANRSNRRGGMHSKYDAAATTTENSNLWRDADGLSANGANSPDVRAKLRNRSRYEDANNGYMGGLIEGRANDCIGTGPRLQLSLPETITDPDFQTPTAIPPGAARAVELLFRDWADAIGLTDKLHVIDQSETRDGEVFGAWVTNPALPETGPQLDVRVIEADQVCSPDLDPRDPTRIDGIRFDAAGNPVGYDVLRRHPGDTNNWFGGGWEYDTLPASRVFHLFRWKRASQARGVPALTAGLPLFGVMRRYTGAVLGAAELAATIAGVLTDESGPSGGGDEPPEVEAMDQIPFGRRTLLTLGRGQDVKAFDPSQPAPSYREFKGEILTEAGRGINAPRNISTGSSAEYNFSSGRLDRLPYQQSIRIRRDRIRRVILDRLFREWVREASLIPGYLPAGLPDPSAWRWLWRWDGVESIDPVKDATANQIGLESGQTTLERVCAERGDDWEEVLEQQAREMRARKRLGLPVPGMTPAPRPAPERDEEAPADA